MVENRDYTLIIDRSGSMSTLDQPGGKSRWAVIQESTLALARKCASQRMERDEELAIAFIQIGFDRRLPNFLRRWTINYRELVPSSTL